MIRLKPDRALAGLVFLQVCLERVDDATWIERAMVRRGAEPDEDSSIHPKSRKLIADAFLSLRNDLADGLSQVLKRVALVPGDTREVLINRLRLAQALLHLLIDSL
jgi:hypothetical protein